MLTILKDSEERPELFDWFGAIDLSMIESWALGLNLVVPRDLLDLWSQTGGGRLLRIRDYIPTNDSSKCDALFCSRGRHRVGQ